MAEDNEASPADGSEGKKEKEEKQQGGLEGIVGNIFKELKDFGKSLFTIGTVAALPYFAYNGIGAFPGLDPSISRSAQTFTATLSAGKATANVLQKKPLLEGVLKEAGIATGMSYILGNTFKGLNTLETRITENYGTIAGKATKVGTWVGVAQPTVVGLHNAFHHGLGKKWREEYWPSLKNVWKYLALPAAINVGILYQFGVGVQLVVSGMLSYVFGLMQARKSDKGSIKNFFSALNPFSYASAGASVVAKAASNITSGLYSGAYGLGEVIRSIFSRKKPTPERKESSPEPGESSEYRRAPVTSKYIPFPAKKARQYKTDSEEISDKIRQFPNERMRQYENKAT